MLTHICKGKLIPSKKVPSGQIYSLNMSNKMYKEKLKRKIAKSENCRVLSGQSLFDQHEEGIHTSRQGELIQGKDHFELGKEE
jgi:hypothetical protein